MSTQLLLDLRKRCLVPQIKKPWKIAPAAARKVSRESRGLSLAGRRARGIILRLR